MRERSDHLSRLEILNLKRKVHCVRSKLRGGGGAENRRFAWSHNPKAKFV